MLLPVLLLLLFSTVQADISAAINTFGLELLQYTPNNENVMISPYSICTAVAMLNTGAAGNTKTQIDEAFGWSGDDTSANYKTLINKINAAGQDAFNLSSSNRIYVDLTFQPEEEYTTELSENFGADLEEVNFSTGDNSATVELINTWVEEQTNGKIEEMFSEIDKAARAILINTVYFKASWLFPFKKNIQDTFYMDAENTIQTDTMQVQERFGYYSDADVELVKMPYTPGVVSKISMVVIKPIARGGLLDVEQNVMKYQFSKVSQWMAHTKIQSLQLSMPKFQFEAKLRHLVDTLIMKFGVTDVFGSNADLSGISKSEGLFVSDFIHQSFISVDENGTEAAAATAITLSRMAIVVQKAKVVKIDQPFIFMIYDEVNKVVLFAGRVVCPNEKCGSAKVSATYSNLEGRSDSEERSDVSDLSDLSFYLGLTVVAIVWLTKHFKFI